MPEMIEKLAESRIAQLDQRENNLKQDPAESQRDRTKLAVAVDETARARYERLFKWTRIMASAAVGT